QTAASKIGPAVRLQRLMRPVRSCATSPARTSTWMCFDRLQRDVEMLRDLRHQQLLPVETAQDGAAYRIGERREHLIERVLAVVRGGRGTADEVQMGGFGDRGHNQPAD